MSAVAASPTPTPTPTPTTFASELEEAHLRGVGAALAGLEDAGLGGLRLRGPGVPVLAQAAVTSATPFLRAPLLARMSAALLLHPVTGDELGRCPTCRCPAPCLTSAVLR